MDSTGCDSPLDTTDLFLPFNSREIESPAYPRVSSEASGISTKVLSFVPGNPATSVYDL